MVLLLVGSGGIISMVSPTCGGVSDCVGGTGSGFAAGSSKLGGMIAPPVAALALSNRAGLHNYGLRSGSRSAVRRPYLL
jgi:hypothetical protein